MAKLDDYRLAIEDCTIRAELSPDGDITRLWEHIREQYKYLLGVETRIAADRADFGYGANERSGNPQRKSGTTQG
jgi:hypothetical protein